jgi:hypothetical protein
VNFAAAPRLKIDQVYPLNAVRRLSETLESTEVVSLFLDASDRIVPQQLSVQFAYFSRTQSAVLVAIPLVLLALGYVTGPLVGRLVNDVGGHLAARIHLGGWNAAPRERKSGVILSREVLGRIRPGATTFEEVLRLCGSDCEVSERLGVPARRTVVYRGERVRPQTRRLIGWLSTVRHREVERHEVTIELEGDMVRDIQVDVRRLRVPAGRARDPCPRGSPWRGPRERNPARGTRARHGHAPVPDPARGRRGAQRRRRTATARSPRASRAARRPRLAHPRWRRLDMVAADDVQAPVGAEDDTPRGWLVVEFHLSRHARPRRCARGLAPPPLRSTLPRPGDGRECPKMKTPPGAARGGAPCTTPR